MSATKTLQAVVLALLPLCLAIPTEVVGSMNSSVQVLSATVKDKPIPGAEVIFQKNGQNSVASRTDASGKAAAVTAFGVDDNSVLMIVKASGYSTLVVKCPCAGLTYALSETMTQLDGMRIVLTWGDHPEDLDAHLVFPGNHIFFYTKAGEHARLDVDNMSGYGPETITIDRRMVGKRYLYAVHTYNDWLSADTKYDTQAKVQVYVGSSLVRTYYFTPRKKDTLLVLFGINEQGEIFDINQYKDQVHGFNAESQRNSSVQTDEVSAHLERALGPTIYIPALDATGLTDIERAKQLNRDGEAAYHRQNIESAIDLYRQAIEIYPGYGQAYSNLGLAYQKSNRIAEALWANRKAIVLADGEKKNVVRASSYYNIARIYESQNQWDSAKQNYQWAQLEHKNDVYRKAIVRVSVRILEESGSH